MLRSRGLTSCHQDEGLGRKLRKCFLEVEISKDFALATGDKTMGSYWFTLGLSTAVKC